MPDKSESSTPSTPHSKTPQEPSWCTAPVSKLVASVISKRFDGHDAMGLSIPLRSPACLVTSARVQGNCYIQQVIVTLTNARCRHTFVYVVCN